MMLRALRRCAAHGAVRGGAAAAAPSAADPQAGSRALLAGEAHCAAMLQPQAGLCTASGAAALLQWAPTAAASAGAASSTAHSTRWVPAAARASALAQGCVITGCEPAGVRRRGISVAAVVQVQRRGAPGGAAQQPTQAPPRVNNQIRAPEVRLVRDDGSHEVMLREEALRAAKAAELDLVEVTPNAKPPVCRLVNYESFIFQARKREKAARKKELERKRRDDIKEVHFKPFIAQHDIDVKLGQALRFLEKGHKVKMVVRANGYKERLAAQETLNYLQVQMQSKARITSVEATKAQRNTFQTMLEPLTSAEREALGSGQGGPAAAAKHATPQPLTSAEREALGSAQGGPAAAAKHAKPKPLTPAEGETPGSAQGGLAAAAAGDEAAASAV